MDELPKRRNTTPQKFFFGDSPETSSDAKQKTESQPVDPYDCIERLFDALDNTEELDKLLEMRRRNSHSTMTVDLWHGDDVLGGDHAGSLQYSVERMYELATADFVHKHRPRTRSLPARCHMSPVLCKYSDAFSVHTRFDRSDIGDLSPTSVRISGFRSTTPRSDSVKPLSIETNHRRNGLAPFRRPKKPDEHLIVPTPIDLPTPKWASKAMFSEIARRGMVVGTKIPVKFSARRIDPVVTAPTSCTSSPCSASKSSASAKNPKAIGALESPTVPEPPKVLESPKVPQPTEVLESHKVSQSPKVLEPEAKSRRKISKQTGWHSVQPGKIQKPAVAETQESNLESKANAFDALVNKKSKRSRNRMLATACKPETVADEYVKTAICTLPKETKTSVTFLEPEPSHKVELCSIIDPPVLKTKKKKESSAAKQCDPTQSKQKQPGMKAASIKNSSVDGLRKRNRQDSPKKTSIHGRKQYTGFKFIDSQVHTLNVAILEYTTPGHKPTVSPLPILVSSGMVFTLLCYMSSVLLNYP